jgi:hypothetical protein
MNQGVAAGQQTAATGVDPVPPAALRTGTRGGARHPTPRWCRADSNDPGSNTAVPSGEVGRVRPDSGFRPALQSWSRHHLTRAVHQRQDGCQFAQQGHDEPLGQTRGSRVGPAFEQDLPREGLRLKVPMGRMLDSTGVRDLIEKPRLIGAVRSHRRGGGPLSLKP